MNVNDFATRLVVNLIDSAGHHEFAEHSFMNFHARGLHYINLFRSPRMSVKLYIFDGAEHNEHGWLVWPHNHSYNFSHQTLIGKISNIRFTMVPWTAAGPRPARNYDIYNFLTPLNGGSGLTKMGVSTGLHGVEDSMNPGDGYNLSSDEIHTIAVDSEYAAAVLVQYHDLVPGRPTMMFAPSGVDAVCDGESDMYHPMDRTDALNFINEFSERWKEANDV